MFLFVKTFLKLNTKNGSKFEIKIFKTNCRRGSLSPENVEFTVLRCYFAEGSGQKLYQESIITLVQQRLWTFVERRCGCRFLKLPGVYANRERLDVLIRARKPANAQLTMFSLRISCFKYNQTNCGMSISR